MSGPFQSYLSLCLLAGFAAAQPKDFARPVLGYVFDSGGRQIRPLSGTPGAALVSAGVSIGVDPDKALVSSAGAFALLSIPGSETLQFIRLEGDPVASPIPGALKTFDSGALSHTAKSAIVYGADCHCVQILTDLPRSPRVEKTVMLAQDAVVQSVGVSGDASVFAVGQRERLSLYVSGEDGPHASLPVSASALAFSPDGQSLAITDATRTSLFTVSDLRGAAELTEIAAERDGLIKATSLSFAPGSRIVVADPEGGIQVIDAGTKRITAVECACHPSMVERTASADLFRLTDVQAGSLWMLQVGEENARAFFVPVRREDAQ